jgi:peptidyl-prolyl cis-trans isomerase A (cyclophilin A)
MMTLGLAAAAAVGVWAAPMLRPMPIDASVPVSCDPPPPELTLAVDDPLSHPASLDDVQAPAEFRVRFDTTEGSFVVEVHRDWAPRGADRLFGLVEAGFYDGTTFFRVIEGFVVQWGIHPSPAVSEVWRDARIDDDPVQATNTRGRVVFATSGAHSRTTQIYVNLADNVRLDEMGFAPFGEVVEGMDVVDRLYSGYGEGAPRGRGPDQRRIQARGAAYVAEFPELDRVTSARLVSGD